jgi:hypothetical protein
MSFYTMPFGIMLLDSMTFVIKMKWFDFDIMLFDIMPFGIMQLGIMTCNVLKMV